jgi:signal transduction histidine kinase
VALCIAQPGGALVCEVGTGELAQLEGDLLPGEGTLEGDAFTTGRAQETDNLRVDPRAYLGRQRGLPNTPALALPVELAGERIGVALFAARRGGEAFGEGRAEVLRQALALVAGALRNFAAHERSRASRAVLDAVRDAGAREADGMRRVVRAVRHELNTPVSAILGNLQLCASADPAQWHLAPPELRQAVSDAAARLEALSRLLHAWDESEAAVEFDPEGRFVSPLPAHHPP